MSAARADGREYKVRDVSNDGTNLNVDVDRLSTEAQIPAVALATPHTRTAYQQWVKPAIDRIGAAILLVITSPLMAAAAIAVRFTMGNPVFLRQERVGRNGDVFTILKFRTMEPDRRRSRNRDNSVAYIGEDRRKTHKHPNDPRITAVGGFLRKWSLDELPQFINVLKGEMSLVGPRPEMVQIVAGYEPWQHQRHAVKPGVTGPWQISERGEKALHECTESDLQYLAEISFLHDLKILALTPLAALGIRRGS